MILMYSKNYSFLDKNDYLIDIDINLKVFYTYFIVIIKSFQKKPMEHELHESTNSTNRYKIQAQLEMAYHAVIFLTGQASGFLILSFCILLLPSIVNGEKGKDVQLSIEMVFVKGGCYQMGDTFGDSESTEDSMHKGRHYKRSSEKPVHEVCVDDFYMGKYEVTVGEFREFVNVTGYITEGEVGDGCSVYGGREWKKDAGKEWKEDKGKDWRNPGFYQNDNHPVCCVSWNDAAAYIEWLYGKTGKSYRLPTEAEWEYAARSGGKAEKWAGTNDESELSDYAWYSKNSESKTHPVGQKKPNGLGLYDMTGNLWEWCSDWYDENYYSNSPKYNPKGVDNSGFRVLRGGTWYNAPRRLRTSVRADRNHDKRSNSSGFRLAAPVK